MMVRKAVQLGFECLVLDPTPDSPAAQAGAQQIVGDFFDPAKLHELVARVDVTTFDIETIDTEALETLYAQGHRILPSPRLLRTVQNKLTQKRHLAERGIPTARHRVLERPDAAAFAEFGYPLVQKAQRGGYDGRGVEVFTNGEGLERMLPVPSLLEEYVDCEAELAVMVARAADADVRVYPAVEMVFDARANILELLLVPARIEAEQARAARELAVATVEALDGVGVFGVELFLARDGRLLVNEVAPRTHNSGHYTIEACVTCQFEQHVRAITGLPLGAPDLLRAAAMVNLLGEPGTGGPALIRGLEEALAIPGAAVHLYGKAESRPVRKMGHATIVDDDLTSARAKAQRLREALQIRGKHTL